MKVLEHSELDIVSSYLHAKFDEDSSFNSRDLWVYMRRWSDMLKKSVIDLSFNYLQTVISEYLNFIIGKNVSELKNLTN